MSNKEVAKVANMLDELGLFEMKKKFQELWSSPEYSKADTLTIFNDIVSEEYISFSNRRYEKNLRIGSLYGREGDIRDLHTHDGRVYNSDNALKQITSLSFMKSGANVSVFGTTNAGKSYVLTSVGIEACRVGYKTYYVDFLDLLDDLMIKRRKGPEEYKKRLNYLIKMPLLIIDDFLTCSDTERLVGFTAIFDLIKKRHARKNSTMIATQYAPNEWPTIVCHDTNLSAEIDAIRRRLIDNAIIISVELASDK